MARTFDLTGETKLADKADIEEAERLCANKLTGLLKEAFGKAFKSLLNQKISVFPDCKKDQRENINISFYPAITAKIRETSDKSLREGLIKRMGIDLTYWREQATHHKQESVRQSFAVLHMAVILSSHANSDPFIIPVIYTSVLFSQKSKAFIEGEELPHFFFCEDAYKPRHKNAQAAFSRSKQKNGAIPSRKKTGK